MMDKRTVFKKVEPLSMRLLVIVSLLALTINTTILCIMFAREQRTVQVTVINGSQP